MKTDPAGENVLLITCIGDDKDRIWDILVDSVKLATVHWDGGQTGRFYDLEFPIPADMTRGKSKISVRMEANKEKTAGRVFGVRILRPGGK
jgi:hypothetical protein